MTDSEKIQKLEIDLADLRKDFSFHRHLGTDATQQLDGNINLPMNSIVGMGNIVAMAASTTSLTAPDDTLNEQFAVGVKTVDVGSTFSRTGSEIQFQDQVASLIAGTQAFFFALKSPMVTSGTISATNGSATTTDAAKGFNAGELAGAIINIGTNSFLVSSNTSSTIVLDSNWTGVTNSYSYTLFWPVFLGSANFPWRRLYTNEIRFNKGASAGATVQWIRTGSGSPEGVVTGNPGSLYLNLSGGTTTSLYVKESGSPMTNTGWVGK